MNNLRFARRNALAAPLRAEAHVAFRTNPEAAQFFSAAALGRTPGRWRPHRAERAPERVEDRGAWRGIEGGIGEKDVGID